MSNLDVTGFLTVMGFLALPVERGWDGAIIAFTIGFGVVFTICLAAAFRGGK